MEVTMVILKKALEFSMEEVYLSKRLSKRMTMTIKFPLFKVSMKDGGSKIRGRYMEDSLMQMGSFMKGNSRTICHMGTEK
jgi:hypothetical protein